MKFTRNWHWKKEFNFNGVRCLLSFIIAMSTSLRGYSSWTKFQLNDEWRDAQAVNGIIPRANDGLMIWINPEPLMKREINYTRKLTWGFSSSQELIITPRSIPFCHPIITRWVIWFALIVLIGFVLRALELFIYQKNCKSLEMSEYVGNRVDH